MNRRTFFRTAMLGIAGAVVAPGVWSEPPIIRGQVGTFTSQIMYDPPITATDIEAAMAQMGRSLSRKMDEFIVGAIRPQAQWDLENTPLEGLAFDDLDD
jgi:uncharacterized protein YneF (UPF0154 family)